MKQKKEKELKNEQSTTTDQQSQTVVEKVEEANQPEKPINTKETNQKFSSKPLSMMEQVFFLFY